jgi:histidine kinase
MVMIKLTGYTFSEKIYESQESIVYRGVRKEDSLPVIIKILNQEFPSEELLFSFKREYEMAKKVSGEDTLLVYDLVKYNNSLGIVMEDIDGITLSDVIHSLVISLAEKLTLSIKIADILSLIHSKNIIHKNINPSNIIWNRNTNRLEIIDFGLAVELKREMTHKMDQGMLEGTPSYSSPEQTGKINQPIDNRSDLYSLGVTLYELFTGQLPFASTDDDEIIYGHIAKKNLSHLI